MKTTRQPSPKLGSTRVGFDDADGDGGRIRSLRIRFEFFAAARSKDSLSFSLLSKTRREEKTSSGRRSRAFTFFRDRVNDIIPKENSHPPPRAKKISRRRKVLLTHRTGRHFFVEKISGLRNIHITCSAFMCVYVRVAF